MNIRTKDFSARTIDDAVSNALREFCLNKEDVEVEVLEQPTKGFFGFGAKNAVVRVTEKFNPAKAGEAFLAKIFEEMKLNTKINIVQDAQSITFNIEGDDLGILIGRRGDTLDSLQFLLNMVVNRKGYDRLKVVIDVENYRAKREETLINLGKKLADKAKRTGQKIILEPMNPQERRIIHLTLQDHPKVNTYSEGEEPYRKVVIVPKR